MVERNDVRKLLIPPSASRSLAIEFERFTGISLIDEVHPDAEKSVLTPVEAKRKRAWLTRIVQGGVRVSGGSKTNLVQVRFDSINPEFAAEIANGLVASFKG